MCQDNFKLTYKLGEHIAMDESTLTYKGRVKFLQYSKSRPNRFHIKLFMVSESETGYISGFSIYTGRASNELSTQAELQMNFFNINQHLILTAQ